MSKKIITKLNSLNTYGTQSTQAAFQVLRTLAATIGSVATLSQWKYVGSSQRVSAITVNFVNNKCLLNFNIVYIC